jgi:hypothetical protein
MNLQVRASLDDLPFFISKVWKEISKFLLERLVQMPVDCRYDGEPVR